MPAKLAPALLQKEQLLLSRLKELGSLIVAYSGGVDSSLLAYYARLVLAQKAKIVIAISPSLAPFELQAAREQALLFDFDLIEIKTDEVSLDQYRRNDDMRCFFCKSTLFDTLHALKEKENIAAIAYGANMDDLDDVRPGHKAAARYNVLAPLVECGLYKSDIRQLAEAAGLPSFDRPQAACLSSRFPHHTFIDEERLILVGKAEDAVRNLGFRQVRVRFHQSDDTAQSAPRASVELGRDELERLQKNSTISTQIEAALVALGFASVYIDPRGYRQGGADIDAGQKIAVAISGGEIKNG